MRGFYLRQIGKSRRNDKIRNASGTRGFRTPVGLERCRGTTSVAKWRESPARRKRPLPRRFGSPGVERARSLYYPGNIGAVCYWDAAVPSFLPSFMGTGAEGR